LGKQILVIDDSQEFLELMNLLLSNAGFDAQLADGVPAAMEFLDRSLPRAILLDLMMPGRNGLEFLENIRWDSRYEGIPVIVITAMTLTEEQREFVDTFAAHFLDKARSPDVVELLNGLLKE
jgi:CheY-like chemotaxis protein